MGELRSADISGLPPESDVGGSEALKAGVRSRFSREPSPEAAGAPPPLQDAGRARRALPGESRPGGEEEPPATRSPPLRPALQDGATRSPLHDGAPPPLTLDTDTLDTPHRFHEPMRGGSEDLDGPAWGEKSDALPSPLARQGRPSSGLRARRKSLGPLGSSVPADGGSPERR